MITTSCYVAGIQPSIPATRFDNAVKLLIAAGMPNEDLARTPSNKLGTIMASNTRHYRDTTRSTTLCP